MRNIRNLVLAIMVMVGISGIESEGIYGWIALAMAIIPLAVLGIEGLNSKKETAKQ